MSPRRRITPSGGNPRVPSANSSRSIAPLGTHSHAASAANASVSSTNTKEKVLEGGDLWALIIFLIGVVSVMVFGLLTFLVAGRMEKNLGTFVRDHWSDLDCGTGPLLVIEVRKPSGLLKAKLPYLAPSFGISFGLAYLCLGVAFLIRKSNLTQWLAGAAAVLGTIFTLLLMRWSSFQALLASLVFTVCSLISIVTWHNSRHISRAIVRAIIRTCKDSPGLLGLSLIVSLSTMGAYTLFLLYLYNMRQIWDTAHPSCSKDRNSYISYFVFALVLTLVFLYWVSIVITTLGQTLAATAAQKYLSNAQPGLGQITIRKCSIGRTLRFGCGSVCFGAGLLALSLFLKDLSMGLMQVSFTPMGIFKAITASLLIALIIYMGPLYAALDAEINDWSFTIIGLDGTSYWTSNQVGSALMSRTGLDSLAKSTGLYSLFTYIPLAIGGTSAIVTYLIVTLIPGPILVTQDVLFAEILISFAFLGGMQITRAVLAPFKGVMCTIWVMMAREPALFKIHHGEIWDGLVEFKPMIAEALLSRT